MLASPALRALCRRRCGFDPAGLSPAQIQERLPRIVAAIEAERQATMRQAIEVQKSALMASRFNELIPNEGLVRSEQIEDNSPAVDADPNAVLDSIIPWEPSL